MARFPGMLGDVYWGAAQQALPDWRDERYDDGNDDDDRELTPEEREQLVGVLGFDPDKYPRGQPGNAGEFGPGGGQKQAATTEKKAQSDKQQSSKKTGSDKITESGAGAVGPGSFGDISAFNPNAAGLIGERKPKSIPETAPPIAAQNSALLASRESIDEPAEPQTHAGESLTRIASTSIAESAPNLELRDSIKSAAEATNTEPTPAQAEVGTYKKGRFRWNGLQVVIENPKGSVRRGVDADGNEWEQGMDLHYGYISRTEGKDGDEIDVFVGPDPESELAFVIDQVKPDGSFDEHKAVIGTTSEEQARDAYLSAYEDGWKGLGSITAMTLDQFKAWLAGDTSRPVALAESAPPANDRGRLLAAAMEMVWGGGKVYP